MKPGKVLIRPVLAALLILLLPLQGWSESAGHDKPSVELFLPSDNALDDVEQAMNLALDSGRLLLVVMGANWCHDSRALASRIFQEPLKSVIQDHYETVFVDVGYLDKGKEVVSAIGPPVYYATPTVLIIDPASSRLLNSDNRHQWGSADTISMKDSVAYFSLMAEAAPGTLPEETVSNTQLKELLEEIDQFEQAQAERLYAAYAVIGPMLQAYKQGNAPPEFDAYWNEVRMFRMSVPGDVDRLRLEAYRRTAAEEQDIQLQFPQYAAFSWD